MSRVTTDQPLFQWKALWYAFIKCRWRLYVICLFVDNGQRVVFRVLSFNISNQAGALGNAASSISTAIHTSIPKTSTPLTAYTKTWALSRSLSILLSQSNHPVYTHQHTRIFTQVNRHIYSRWFSTCSGIEIALCLPVPWRHLWLCESCVRGGGMGLWRGHALHYNKESLFGWRVCRVNEYVCLKARVFTSVWTS